MSLLDARDLSRRYGVRTILDGVSLTLSAGERVGVVGANGSGKSTLGRILAGVEEADAGEVVRRKGARVGFLPQEPVYEGDPTAIEAALAGLSEWSLARARHHEATQALGSATGPDVDRWLHAQADAAAAVERLGGWEREHQAEALLTRLGVRDPSQRVSTMSGGERRRVDLARLLVARPDVAILDEPTNHLDVETIEWLEGHLRDEQPGALLVITHDRVFLDRMVHRTAELSNGTLRVYEGGYEAYLEARLEREAHEARAEQNRQNLMRRELEWLRRGPAARTTKQKARIQRAEAIIGQRGPQAARDVALSVDTVRSGKTVLVLDELRLDVGGRTLVDGLTMALTPGERIGIVGPNGAGKTTLLRAVLGELAPTAGRVIVGQNARVTYLGQTREGLDEDATVFENVAGGRSRVDVGEQTMDTRGYLERFLFDGHQQRQKVSSLSGGERARVLLAKLLLVPTNLLILDEPTNDLDLPTLSALEQMLVELKGTALVVTHDRWFLDRVATGILAFEGDGEVVRYPGGYSMYRALKREQEASAPSERPAPRASEPAPRTEPTSDAKSDAKGAPKNKKSLTYGERIELDGILDRIAEAEARVAELERALADPALYQGGGGDASGLVSQLDEARESVTTLMARWEHLEAKSAG